MSKREKLGVKKYKLELMVNNAGKIKNPVLD